MPNSATQQSMANHARLDPAYHFFVAPVAALSVIVAIVRAVRYPDFWSFWLVLAAAAAAVAVLKIRTYALKAQDRVIRLEERLRIAQKLMTGRVDELTEPQLIALRFAHDSEVGALAERALKEKLSARQIKEAVRVWRPDYFRI